MFQHCRNEAGLSAQGQQQNHEKQTHIGGLVLPLIRLVCGRRRFASEWWTKRLCSGRSHTPALSFPMTCSAATSSCFALVLAGPGRLLTASGREWVENK